jgi:Tripartite tricarboxylate transporter TctB family
MRKVDIVVAALLLVLVGVMLFVVIPMEDEGGKWHGLSPYFFPVLMLFGVAVSCVGLLYQALTKPSMYVDQPNPLTWSDLGFFLLISAIIFVTTVIIHRYGMWIGGPLMIAAAMIFMGERSPIRIVPTAIITVAIAQAIATYGLQTPLP